MNEELAAIGNRAQWAQKWPPVATAVVQLCNYIAKLEDRLVKLEQAETETE